MQVTEVLEEILKDSAFFARSGGGVTLGGGEPLVQPEFAAALLQSCGEHGLHRAVETAGSIPWDILAQVVPHADLFLFDVKHIDPVKLERFTGGDATLIQRNLDSLSRRTKHLVVRIPIVPGFNDTEAEVRSIARGLHHRGISELHLLPYHRYGQEKYQLLGRDYRFAGPFELAPGVLDCLQRAATDEGLRVKVGG